MHIFREVAGEFERPVILFSGGKDSIVMLHLALKAFAPAAVPFTLLHVDTGHNFPEVLEYRDRTVERARAAAARRLRAGLHRRAACCASVPTAPATRCRRVPLTEKPSRPRPLRRRLRRRTPRRGEGPRQGAGLLPARRVLAVGPAPPAPRAVARSTTAGTRPASTSASSRCPTGPSWTSGSTSPARASSCRTSTSPTSARSSSGPACG